MDHTQFLGNSLEQIAMEKAGIIKKDVPVVIGETTPETRMVFETVAVENHAPIVFAEEHNQIISVSNSAAGFEYNTKDFGIIKGEPGWQLSGKEHQYHSLRRTAAGGSGLYARMPMRD